MHRLLVTNPLRQIHPSNLRPAPVEDEQTEIVYIGPPSGDRMRVYLWADVLHELIRVGLESPSRLHTALLLGRIGLEMGSMRVEIRGYMDLEVHDDLQEFCQSTNEYWPQIQNRMERRTDELRLHGWVCIQSGDEGRLTRTHQVVHRSFFNYPHQLFMMIDPTSQNVGLYGFDENGRLVHIGYHLVRVRPTPTDA